MSVKFTDSVDKIVQTYFKAITTEPFTYKGKEYKPSLLKVSPLIFRGYLCPENCGACCYRFSLDYLPFEPKPDGPIHRVIEFNGKNFSVHSILQEKGKRFCKWLLPNGRCAIHGVHPLSCKFELMRFSIPQKDDKPVYLSIRKYGRAWQMKRVDGEVGALCEIGDYDSKVIQSLVRSLVQLGNWAHYFELKTCIMDIIEWVAQGPKLEPLTIDNRREKDEGFFR